MSTAQIVLICLFFFVPLFISPPLWLSSSLPLSSPPRSCHNYHHFPQLPHTLIFMPFHASHLSLLLCSAFPCRSSSHPSLPYHYYEPLGPDECSMYLSHERSRRGSHHRFITEKAVFANWARTLNIHFHQPDWKPAALTTSMNSSYTPVPAGSWGSLKRRPPEVWNMCVEGFQHALSLWTIWKNETAVGQNRTELLWLLAHWLSSLAEWDHCVITERSPNNVLEV